MADRRRVRWDEAVLSKNPRWCRTSSYDKPLSPYPKTGDVTSVYDDSTDTDDTLTDTEDTLIGKDGALTDSDDTLNYMDDASTDTDGALVNKDDILIGKDGSLIDSKDDLTDTDDTLIGKDGTLTDTNDAPPKTDYGSLTMKFILSIDGGGIRGYSTLMILQALMDEIEEIERADTLKPTSSICSSALGPPDDELCAVSKPTGTPVCERLPLHYFDYIGGTGSGNVIAMMLAEGKMSVAEVTDAYRDMCAPGGGKRRLVNKKVVFEKRGKASRWLHDYTMKPLLAWASPNNKQEGANPPPAHFRLLDDSSAIKNGIYLLSIGSAITEPVVYRSADPLLYRLSKQIQIVHQELSLRTGASNQQNPLFNLKRYVRLDVHDAELGDIGVDGWGCGTEDERTRWRVVRATDVYLQGKEIREEIHTLASERFDPLRRDLDSGAREEKGSVDVEMGSCDILESKTPQVENGNGNGEGDGTEGLGEEGEGEAGNRGCIGLGV